MYPMDCVQTKAAAFPGFDSGKAPMQPSHEFLNFPLHWTCQAEFSHDCGDMGLGAVQLQPCYGESKGSLVTAACHLHNGIVG